MANENRYYNTPFAESGDKTEVPNISTGGAVGFDTGFGPDYELPQGVSNRKRIERDMWNGLQNGITGNIKQWQESLYPTWIEDNGTGVAFSYTKGMFVNHNNVDYVSLEDANQEEPGVGDKWIVKVSEIDDLSKPHEFKTVALMVDSTLIFPIGKKLTTSGYLVAGDGGGNDYEVVAAGTSAADGGSFIDTATQQAKGLFPGGVITFEQFGASTAESYTQLQALFNYARLNEHTEITSRNIRYLSTGTLLIDGGYAENRALKIRMHPGGAISSPVSGGDFAVDLRSGLFQDLELYIENTEQTGNGLRIRHAQTAGVDNSNYNKVKGRCQRKGGGKSVTKPAVGVGSIGVLFDEVVVGQGDSNYFNILDNGFRVRSYDNSIVFLGGANAQQVYSPQIEDYWYGLVVDSDEVFISGGFAHSSAGTDASNLTEAIYIMADRTLNTIDGFVIEPGSFSSAGTIETGASGNKIDVINNSSNPFVNNGNNNGAIDEPDIYAYTETLLTENTYYQVGRFTMATNTRKAFGKLRWDSHNATTTASSSGEADFIISRDSGGTITATLIKDSGSRQGLGSAQLSGFEINGNDIHPVFFITNNATATSVAVIDFSVEATRTLGITFRHVANTVAPTIGLTASLNNTTNIVQLSIGSDGTDSPITRLISKNVTDIDFPSVADGDFSVLNKTLTGVSLGDTVLIGVPIEIPDGAFITISVQATDMVKITLHNESGGNVDLANFTPRIDVWKH